MSSRRSSSEQELPRILLRNNRQQSCSSRRRRGRTTCTRRYRWLRSSTFPGSSPCRLRMAFLALDTGPGRDRNAASSRCKRPSSNRRPRCRPCKLLPTRDRWCSSRARKRGLRTNASSTRRPTSMPLRPLCTPRRRTRRHCSRARSSRTTDRRRNPPHDNNCRR